MQTFKYTLKNNQPKRYKSLRLISILFGAFYFLIGLFYLIFNKQDSTKAIQDSTIGIINLIGGMLFMVTGFFERYTEANFFIQFDSKKISASYKKLNILWEDIQNVHIAPVKIFFNLSNGSKLSLPLDNLSYNDIMLVKSKFNEFAKFKSIEID